jgi:hypothetical protein
VDDDRTYASKTIADYPPPRDPGRDDFGPRQRKKAPILVGLAVLLVATIVGTTYLVMQQLHSDTLGPVATATTALGTPTPRATATPDGQQPTNNDWTLATAAAYGDAQFSASSPQTGYLCGTQADGKTHIFGVTTTGGQSWQVNTSPASYNECVLQVSPTNPLDVTITSVNGPGDGQSAYVDAHYSTNGGQSWQAAPIPPNTVGQMQLTWAGQYLYLMRTDYKGASTLQVNANGGGFVTIPLGGLIAGEPNPFLSGGLAGGNTYYLNIQTNACQSPCNTVLTTTDGGASWSKLPNNGNIFLDAVVGNTLFGTVRATTFLQTIQRSSDGGASWDPTPAPTLTDGPGFSYYIVAPDKSLYTSFGGTVYAWLNGKWINFPFATGNQDSIELSAVSVNASGEIARLWGHDEGAHLGVYSHAL